MKNIPIEVTTVGTVQDVPVRFVEPEFENEHLHEKRREDFNEGKNVFKVRKHVEPEIVEKTVEADWKTWIIAALVLTSVVFLAGYLSRDTSVQDAFEDVAEARSAKAKYEALIQKEVLNEERAVKFLSERKIVIQ